MIRQLWPLLLGFVLWAGAFVVLYAMQALGCVWAWPAATHRTVLVVIWIATISLLGLALLWQWRQRLPLPAKNAGMLLTIAATAATFATYFPVTFVTLCL